MDLSIPQCFEIPWPTLVVTMRRIWFNLNENRFIEKCHNHHCNWMKSTNQVEKLSTTKISPELLNCLLQQNTSNINFHLLNSALLDAGRCQIQYLQLFIFWICKANQKLGSCHMQVFIFLCKEALATGFTGIACLLLLLILLS